MTGVAQPCARAVGYVVVMGIAGCGKTIVGSRLSDRIGASFVEADEFHSPQNVAKMSQGIGLTDDDRWPWLEAICDAALSKGPPCVVACSALKRRYRDFIRQRLGYVHFLYLSGSHELIGERLQKRKGHFAGASLLESQMKALEPPGPDESATVLDVSDAPDEIVRHAVWSLNNG